MLWSVIFLADV